MQQNKYILPIDNLYEIIITLIKLGIWIRGPVWKQVPLIANYMIRDTMHNICIPMLDKTIRACE